MNPDAPHQCPQCEELQARIGHLETELGLRVGQDEAAAMKRAFGLTPSEAKLVLGIYRAGGSCVSRFQLEGVLYGDRADDDRRVATVQVLIHKARAKLPGGFVCTDFGRGYWMPTFGIERISALLSGLSSLNQGGEGMAA